MISTRQPPIQHQTSKRYMCARTGSFPSAFILKYFKKLPTFLPGSAKTKAIAFILAVVKRRARKRHGV